MAFAETFGGRVIAIQDGDAMDILITELAFRLIVTAGSA
jgi:hypothetical protein